MSKIFLADDHPVIAAAFQAVLGAGDHELAGYAANGADALSAIAVSDADILVLDSRMPGGCGLHVLGELRARGDLRPVILLTDMIRPEGVLSALSLGAAGVFVKTSQPSDLLDAIAKVSIGETWIDKSLRMETGNDPPRRKRAISERERQLIALVRRGQTNRRIAERIGITEGTVKLYLHALFRKLGVRTRTELALKANEILASTEY